MLELRPSLSDIEVVTVKVGGRIELLKFKGKIVPVDLMKNEN